MLTRVPISGTASGIRQLQAMAKTLLRQAKGILSFYHTGLTSGKMEGINRKIRGLLARAFGFRDARKGLRAPKSWNFPPIAA